MRPRVRRKGFSKHLRRYLNEEINFDDDWADQVAGGVDDCMGGPIDRPTDPSQQGGNAA